MRTTANLVWVEAVPEQVLQLPLAAGGPLQGPSCRHCTIRCHHMATGLTGAATAWSTIMVQAEAVGRRDSVSWGWGWATFVSPEPGLC